MIIRFHSFYFPNEIHSANLGIHSQIKMNIYIYIYVTLTTCINFANSIHHDIVLLLNNLTSIQLLQFIHKNNVYLNLLSVICVFVFVLKMIFSDFTSSRTVTYLY